MSVARRRSEVADEHIYALEIRAIWQYLKGESFAFWMICAYLFFEYVRPQSIYPVIDILPWTQLTVVGAFLGCFTDKTVKWVSSPINKLLIIFLFIILLSSAFAYFPEVSYKNLDKYYLWLIIYFLIINIVNSRKRFFIFICVFLAASLKISLALSIVWAKRGFSFTDWGLKGPPGFFENSGELAIQMLVFWPLSWAFIISIKPYINKNWYRMLMLMPITAIMVILGASSRGAQIALVVQLLLINYRYIFTPKIVVSFGLVMFLVWTLLPDEQKDRFHTIGDDQTSQQRILYFENGIEMIMDNPVIGVGFFNFSPYYQRYYEEDVLFHRAELPHNIFIQIGTDTGVMGLVVFILMILFAFRYGSKFKLETCEASQVVIGRCANISLVGYLMAGQFVTVGYYPFFWIHLAFLIAMKNSFELTEKAKKGRS